MAAKRKPDPAPDTVAVAGEIPVPMPVVIAPEQAPIPVVQVAPDGKRPLPLSPTMVTKKEGTTLAPTTTEADDLVTEGQRHINRLWEHTQAYISMGVTFATILIIGAVVLIAAFTGHEITQAMATQINYLVVMTTLILSFYFSRTNHQATGGVGPKPDPSVQSR